MGSKASWFAHGLRAAAAIAALVGADAAASAAPQIAISPDPVTCDTWWSPGTWGQGPFDVRNTGDAPLAVTDMRITGTDATTFAFDPMVDPSCGGGLDCAAPYTLAPGEVRHSGIQCAPDQPRTFTASLTVTSNAASGNPTVALTCELGAPEVTASPSPLTFPIVRAERDGATEALTIANVATPPAGSFSFSIAGAPWWDPAAFTVVGWPCAGTSCELAPGESQTYTITFHPYNTDPFTAPIVLTNQVPGWGPASIEVPLFAQGGWPRLAFVDPPDGNLVLATVPVGERVTGTITVTDAGPVDMFVWSVSTDGDVERLDGPNYQFTVAPGAQVTWTVACTPPSYDGGHGRLVFDTDVQDFPIDAQVSCGGLGAALTVDRGQILFGEVAVGGSATSRVRVTNPGNLSTTLTAISSDDPRFVAAPVGANLPVALAAGAWVDVDVTFTPIDHDPAAAWIAFATSTGDSARLRVFGDSATVSPDAYDFGVIALPATPAHDFVLANGGELPVTIAAVTLDAPADFAVAGLDAGAEIAPSTSLAFEVSATPSRLGRRHATLAIGYGGLAAVAVPLDAIATDPALAVMTGDATAGDYALDAGAVDVDVGARTAHVTLRDDGAAPVAITACAITGDGAAAFAIASACPFTIDPGATADVAIAFDPDAEASYRGVLTLDGTGFATGALAIELAGTGLDQHVALSALAVDFPDTFRHPTAAAIAVVTVHNTATVALPLTTIAVDGDGFALGGPTSALLAPGASGDVAVTFAPPAVGAFTGHLVLGNADDPAIARIGLTGRGVDRTVEVSPLVIDLGDAPVDAPTRLGARGGAIAIRDLDPAASFTVRDATIAGDDGWRVIGPDRRTIAPGEAAALDVELTPTAPGPHAATIDVFLDEDPAPHARITITARAVQPPEPPTEDRGCGCASGRGGAGAAIPFALVAFGLGLRRPARRCRGT